MTSERNPDAVQRETVRCRPGVFACHRAGHFGPNPLGPPQEVGFGQPHVSGRGAPGRPAPLTASNSSTVNSLIVFFDSLMICSVIPTLPCVCLVRLPGPTEAWIMIALSNDRMTTHELKNVQLRMNEMDS